MAAPGTPWFKVFSQVRTHPKIEDLADALDISIPQAIGHLACLWAWVVDFAPDGNMEDFSDSKIERAAMWTDEKGAFISEMRTQKLLDHGNKIHNWTEYSESYNRAQKQKAKRAKAKEDSESTDTVPDEYQYSTDTVPTQDTESTPQDGAEYRPSTDRVPLRGEELRGDEISGDDVSENPNGTITSHHGLEFFAEGFDLRPITGRDAPRLAKLFPLTTDETQIALDAMKQNAAKPGWGYLTSCLESARKKPPTPERDPKYGQAEVSQTFNEDATL